MSKILTFKFSDNNYQFIAQNLFENKQYSKCIKYCLNAIDFGRTNQEKLSFYNFYIAKSFDVMGELDFALQYSKNAFMLDSGNLLNNTFLLDLLSKKGDYKNYNILKAYNARDELSITSMPSSEEPIEVFCLTTKYSNKKFEPEIDLLCQCLSEFNLDNNIQINYMDIYSAGYSDYPTIISKILFESCNSQAVYKYAREFIKLNDNINYYHIFIRMCINQFTQDDFSFCIENIKNYNCKSAHELVVLVNCLDYLAQSELIECNIEKYFDVFKDSYFYYILDAVFNYNNHNIIKAKQILLNGMKLYKNHGSLEIFFTYIDEFPFKAISYDDCLDFPKQYVLNRLSYLSEKLISDDIDKIFSLDTKSQNAFKIAAYVGESWLFKTCLDKLSSETFAQNTTLFDDLLKNQLFVKIPYKAYLLQNYFIFNPNCELDNIFYISIKNNEKLYLPECYELSKKESTYKSGTFENTCFKAYAYAFSYLCLNSIKFETSLSHFTEYLYNHIPTDMHRTNYQDLAACLIKLCLKNNNIFGNNIELLGIDKITIDGIYNKLTACLPPNSRLKIMLEFYKIFEINSKWAELSTNNIEDDSEDEDYTMFNDIDNSVDNLDEIFKSIEMDERLKYRQTEKNGFVITTKISDDKGDENDFF